MGARTIPGESQPPTAAPARRGVLVVDDEAPVRTLLTTMLVNAGFDAWQAADGLQAVDLYRRRWGQIDLVVLDVSMPGLDGPQTLRALRAINPQVRACFMTAGSGIYQPEFLLEQGALRVFAKPFQLAEVCQYIARMAGGGND